MTMYAIAAAINTFDPPCGWTGTRQLPTFFLDSTVQGIVDAEHAEKIAHDILDRDGATVHCCAVKL